MAKKEQKENSKKENKNQKSFFKGFKAELKKVSWPTPKQLANNTIAVITIVLLTAVIVFILDLAFETINTQGVNRLRNVVGTSENTVSTDNSISNEIDNAIDNAIDNSIDNTVTDNTVSE